MKQFLRRNPLVLPVTVLVLATIAGGLLLAARVAISRRLHHFYLPWNLFLAWLPVGLAFAVRFVADRKIGPRWSAWLLGTAWLLFLPNAPYLLTDLVHLPDRQSRQYFPDMMLILHFALVGVALGGVSLHIVHDVVERRCGWIRGWAFTAAVAALTGLGIYIGRIMRWNSWDVVAHPWSLAVDLAGWTLRLHDRPSELILPALFGSTTMLAYLLFASFLRPSIRASDASNSVPTRPSADAITSAGAGIAAAPRL